MSIFTAEDEMTGDPTAVQIQEQIQPENFEQRFAFTRWLYSAAVFFGHSPAGELARALNREFRGFENVREHVSSTWPSMIARKGWKIDADLLMKTWQEWREKNNA